MKPSVFLIQKDKNTTRVLNKTAKEPWAENRIRPIRIGSGPILVLCPGPYRTINSYYPSRPTQIANLSNSDDLPVRLKLYQYHYKHFKRLPNML